MQHRAQQADDGLQRRFAFAGREFRAVHAFMQQALAELDHRQAFRQPGSDADFTAAQLLLQQRSWQQQEA